MAMLDLANALIANRLQSPYSAIQVAACVPNAECDTTARELERMHADGLDSRHIASILNLLATERGANQQAIDRLQLVWTGPEVPGAVSRDTGVVVRELFNCARRSVLLSTFTIRHGEEVFATLAESFQQNPSLQIRLVVNVSRNGDYSSSEQQLLSRFADEFWTEHWPWSQRPLVYFDPRGLSLDKNVIASLHAKCIIVDDEIAFVTSANFTEWAQERNVEAGVLIRDENFARTLRNQFDALIAARRLLLLPGSAHLGIIET
ncbi:MAG: DISARM system phospholipase D-like protein DrmC [Bryobacteraceae bacterium]